MKNYLIVNNDEKNKYNQYIKTKEVDNYLNITIKNKKVLELSKYKNNIDYIGMINKIVQYVNIANLTSKIEKSSEYIVQIPAKYKDALEVGEVFINKNKLTGTEWPSLMKKMDNGQYKFVENLSIKQKNFVNGNLVQDINVNFQNILLQQQLSEISKSINDVYNIVKKIEVGQQDDRIALIEAGKEQILLAMSLNDENEKRERLRLASRDLLVGKEQIGKALIRRVEAFEPIPNSRLKYYYNLFKDTNYNNKKDNDILEIQECYYLYIESTKLLASVFDYLRETFAIEQTFNKSIEFLQSISFESLKSIQLAHKDTNFSDWFFCIPIEYMQFEKNKYIDLSKDYDYIQIKLNGENLLGEVIDNGKISEEEF